MAHDEFWNGLNSTVKSNQSNRFLIVSLDSEMLSPNNFSTEEITVPHFKGEITEFIKEFGALHSFAKSKWLIFEAVKADPKRQEFRFKLRSSPEKRTKRKIKEKLHSFESLFSRLSLKRRIFELFQ